MSCSRAGGTVSSKKTALSIVALVKRETHGRKQRTVAREKATSGGKADWSQITLCKCLIVLAAQEQTAADDEGIARDAPQHGAGQIGSW